MQTDPIVEETRRLRREYVQQFGFDLFAIAADLRECEQRHPERLVKAEIKPLCVFATVGSTGAPDQINAARAASNIA